MTNRHIHSAQQISAAAASVMPHVHPLNDIEIINLEPITI